MIFTLEIKSMQTLGVKYFCQVNKNDMFERALVYVFSFLNPFKARK